MSFYSSDDGYSNVGQGEEQGHAQELRGARRAMRVRVHMQIV